MINLEVVRNFTEVTAIPPRATSVAYHLLEIAIRYCRLMELELRTARPVVDAASSLAQAPILADAAAHFKALQALGARLDAHAAAMKERI